MRQEFRLKLRCVVPGCGATFAAKSKSGGESARLAVQEGWFWIVPVRRGAFCPACCASGAAGAVLADRHARQGGGGAK